MRDIIAVKRVLTKSSSTEKGNFAECFRVLHFAVKNCLDYASKIFKAF